MIIQGINAVFNLTIRKDDNTTPFDLDQATVTFALQRPDSKTIITKEVIITDSTNGKCKVLLSPDDLSEAGTYKYQIVMQYPDNTKIKSAIHAFYVADAIT